LKSIKEVDREFKDAYSSALKKHGSHQLIPKDELLLMGERHRAECVFITTSERSASALRGYSIANRVIEELCGSGAIEPERKVRNVDKRKAVRQWMTESVGSVVTVNDVAEAGQFSEATARKFMNEHITYFLRVSKGSYEVRDPEADRIKEKEGSK
jgi:predicted transcriptional regulator of viral defense system